MAPTILPISTQSISEDSSLGVPFSIADHETVAPELAVSASSSDQSLVPNSNLSILGTDENRTLHAVPAPNSSGSATITVRVTDPAGLSSSTSFTLNVLPVNDAPAISVIAAQVVSLNSPSAVINFSVNDVETGAGSITVTAYSSDSSLIRTEDIQIGGGGVNRTVQFTPRPNVLGSATITIRAEDPDGAASIRMFSVQVNAAQPGWFRSGCSS
jgi:hypothetical protein